MHNNIIKRNKSLLDKESTLEHLHTFSNCPASMACTNQSKEKDLVMDQIWDICQKTGLIQLRNVFPLDVVYKFPHNDGIGKVWENHDKAFSNFILEFDDISSVFEIGAGAGRLGKLFLNNNNNGQWIGLEPNHYYETIEMENFIHKRSWFDENYKITDKTDAIVHSHVLEHMYDPLAFLKTIHDQIGNEEYHLFSIPNLFHFIKEKYTNGLNFEHTLFITEDIIDNLLKKLGFSLIKKQYYSEFPCIFYACKKADPKDISWDSTLYKKNKDIFLDFVKFHAKDVSEINKKIDSFTAGTVNGKVYLFGAHIFSQFLIYNGLQTDKVSCILDNSKMKQKSRLYGTNFYVESPEILKGEQRVAIILKAGQYNNEIKNSIIKNINSEVLFWE